MQVKQDSTFCIDPEFAFYGPMGFDTGAFLANMLLSYFSHAANKGDEYAEWVLEQTIIYYETFETLFLQLWNDAHAAGKVGDLYPTNQFQGDVLVAAQKSYMAELWRDTRGFAGMKMIRRIVGTLRSQHIILYQSAYQT
jgi:5-methylthioribose kinase